MASAASPSWAILGAVPRVTDADADLPPGADLSLALPAPPRVALLTIPPRIFPGRTTSNRYPSVIAVDASGLLLLKADQGPATGPTVTDLTSRPRSCWRPTVADYFVLDAKSGSALLLPNAKYIRRPGHRGIIACPGDASHYVVAELQMTVGGDAADLLCFSSRTEEWVCKEDVHCPLPSRPYSTNDVVSHSGRLWWVDLSWCLLTCDPFSDKPVLTVVPLPEGKTLKPKEASGLLDKYRCVGVSCGKLRFVDMYRNLNSSGAAQISVWTLADPDSTKWTLEYEATFGEICDDVSYKATGLPRKIPVLALIHPTNPDVVYFFQDEHMLGVDLRARKVVECEVYELVEPPREHVSSRFVHVWQLPRALCSGSAKETEDGVNEELQQLQTYFRRRAMRNHRSCLLNQNTPEKVRLSPFLPVASSYVASSSCPPPTSWAILAMIPRTCASDAEPPQVGNLSLALAAPPSVSLLGISQRIFKDVMTGHNYPSVLTADPSGILLLHTTQGLTSTPLIVSRPGHFSFLRRKFIDAFYICDLVSGTTFELPSPPNAILNVGNLGLVMVPGGSSNYIVAELRPIIGSNYASLLSFSSESGKWQEKNLHYKLPLRPWGSHRVLSHNHKLWWVDVSWGLLSCDPSDFSPLLHFVRLPMGKVLPFNSEGKDLEGNRCIQVSGGHIMFVEISEGVPIRPSVFVHSSRHLKMCHGAHKVYCIKTWILTNPESSVWKLKRNVYLDYTIWYGETYTASGLPKRKPKLALIHPTDPDIVFFFVGERVMSINMSTERIEQCCEHKMISPPSDFLSSRFVHAWQLPPMLNSGFLQSDGGNGSNVEVSAPLSVSSSMLQSFHPSVGGDSMSEHESAPQVSVPSPISHMKH